LTILTPTADETVYGGMVLCTYDASETTELLTVDVYVNAEYITSLNVYGSIREFCVPVFENGTNTILLEGNWNDASTANDSVVVFSIDVIPIVNIKEGDWLNYRQEDLINLHTYDINFTFTTWLSTYEMLTVCSFLQYNATHTINQDVYLLTINVLNGYVSADTGLGFEFQHFFPFATLPPNPIVGDKTSWVPWDAVLTVNGSTTWKFTECWTAEFIGSSWLFYIDKSTNIVDTALIPGYVDITLLNSSIDFTNPYITDESDFAYIVGDTGNSITWIVADRFPGSYVITRDGVGVDSGFWNVYNSIAIDVDGLAEGTYTYQLVIMDCAGNTAQDTVIVTVNPVVPEFGSQFLIFLPILVLTTYLITKRKK
jgi:hypothetical protein